MDIGNRIGILWTAADAESIEDTDAHPTYGQIRNVIFERFAGSGLYCNQTTKSTNMKLLVSDCYFLSCDCGIWIFRISEFHQFSNCCIRNNAYGVINNGGNNNFVGCMFATNKHHFLVDNNDETKDNNTHSVVVGCGFLHADHNNGTAIEVIKAQPGLIFSGCSIGYGKTILTDSQGIMFNGCMWSGSSDNDIIVTRGGGVIFNSCEFTLVPPITITENNVTRFINCYTKDGLTEITQ